MLESGVLRVLPNRNWTPSLSESVSTASTAIHLMLPEEITFHFFLCWYRTVGRLIWKFNLSNQHKKNCRKNETKNRNETRKSEVGKEPSVIWFGYGKVNWTANKHKKHQFRVHTHTPNYTLIHTDSPYKAKCDNSSHDNVHMCVACNAMYRRLLTIIAYHCY